MRASIFLALVSLTQLCGAARPTDTFKDFEVVPLEDLKRCPYPLGYNRFIKEGQTPDILLVGQETVNGELICRYEASKLPTSTGPVLLKGGVHFEYGSCSYSFHESVIQGYRRTKRWERVDESVNGSGDRAMLAEKKFIFCPVLPGLTPDMTMRITSDHQ